MPAILREVLKTHTLEEQRQIINILADDFRGYTLGQLSSSISLIDGSAANPSLFFSDDSDTGLYRDQYLKVSSNGATIAAFEDTRLKFSKKIESDANTITQVSVASSGNYYFPSDYVGSAQQAFNVPFNGGTGDQAVLSVIVQPFQSSVSTYGSYTTIGSFEVSFTNGSGSNGTGTVTIRGINGGTIVGGSGYTDYQYTNIDLNGGNGSGAEASVTVNGGTVTAIGITNHGSGYQEGDVLTLGTMSGTDPDTGNPFTSGGAGASYTVPANPYGVISLVPNTTWNGQGYEVGDVVGFTGGGTSGSGGTFTLDKVGYVESVEITGESTGFGYEEGDILTPWYSFGTGEIVNGIVDYIDLTVNTVNHYYVEITSSSSFSAGETLSFSGGSTADITTVGLNSNGDAIYLYIENESGLITSSETFTSSGGGSGTVDSYGASLVFEIRDPDTGLLTILPEFNLRENYVYNFIQDDIEFTSYPIQFSTSQGGSSYTTLVRTIQTSENRNVTQLVVTPLTPDLYYSTEVLPDSGGHTGVVKTLSSPATPYDASGFTVLVDSISQGQISISMSSSGDFTSTGNTSLNNLYVGGSAEFANLATGSSTFSGSSTTIESDDTFINSTLNVNDGTFVVHPEGKVSFKSTDLPTRDVYLNSSFETQGNTILSSTDSDYTTIGLVSTPEAKFEVAGDSKFNGKVIVSDGSLNNPSVTFDSDRTVGLFLGEEVDGDYNLSVNNREGAIAKFTKDQTNFFRDVYLTTSEITEFSFIKGFGYTYGEYTGVQLIGGSGGGLIVDVTVAFDVNITNPGQAYTNATYLSIHVSYDVLPEGAIQTVDPFVSGSNYSNGTYNNVALTGGSGINATGNFTISGGNVTSFSINSKGSDYEVGDVLEVDVADVGGSKLGTLSIVNAGQDYQEGSYVGIPLDNLSGTGSNGTVDVTVNSSGQIASVTLVDSGAGYLQNDTFTLNLNVNGTQTFNITQPGGTGTALYLNGVDRTGSSLILVESSSYTFDNSSISEPIIIASAATGPADALESNVGVDYQLDGLSVTSSDYINNFSSATTKKIIYTVPSGLTANEDIHHYFISTDPNTGGQIEYAVQASGTGSIINADSVISGSGFSVEVATIGQATSAGTGATATIVIDNGTIDTFAITNPGTGYNVGHQLTMNTSDMVYDDGFALTQTETPTDVIKFTVSKLGAITVVDITDDGTGYIEGDKLTLNASPGSGLDNGDAGVFDITSIYVSTIDSPITATLSESGFVVTLTTDQNPSPAVYGTFPGENNTFTVSDNNLSQQYIVRVGQNTQASTLVDINVGSSNGFLVNGSPIYSPSVGNQIADPPSQGATTFTAPSGFNWNIGNTAVGDTFDIDSAGGFAVSGNLYQYSLPNFLKSGNWSTVFATNSYYSGSNFNSDNSRHADGHSKIIGIAADGYPIYGPFGYTTFDDNLSGVSRQTSSYRTKLNDNHRPAGSKYTDTIVSSVDPTYTITLSAGIFIEDYEYVNGLGTLDQFNGRYCVTPEYPDGTYAYFATFDNDDISLANATYPYFIGTQFKETPFTLGSTVTDPGGINANTINTSDFILSLDTVTVTNTISLTQESGTISAKSLNINESFTIEDILTFSSTGISSPDNIDITAGAGGEGGTDYFVRIGGTTALSLPRGTTAQRPGISTRAGSIRFNTDDRVFEGYDGEYFVSLGGVIDVDGNTYITAERSAGDDDNILRFYNDGQQSLSVGLDRIIVRTPTYLDIYNVENATEWYQGDEATAPADLINDPPVLVYYGENVYSVDTTGTFDTDPLNFPTHTTGTVTNGTVDLTWVRSSFGSFNIKGNDLSLELNSLNFNSRDFVLKSDGSQDLNISSDRENINLRFGDSEVNEKNLLRVTSSGSILVNNDYGTSDDFVEFIDYTLSNLSLKRTRIFNNQLTLDTSVGNAASTIITEYDSDNGVLPEHSGKFMVEIVDDSTTPRRQYSEISYLVKSDLSDTIYVENNKIYTNILLCDISLGLDASNNVTLDIVDVTGSTTTIYTVTVVSQSIKS